MYLKQRAWRQRIHWIRTSSVPHHLHAVSTAYSSTIQTTNLLGPHSQKLKAPFEYVGFCADNDFNVFFLWKNQLCSEWLSRVFLSKLSRLSWKTCRINAISRWISEIKVSLKLPEFMVFYLKSSIWLSQNKNNIPFQRN